MPPDTGGKPTVFSGGTANTGLPGETSFSDIPAGTTNRVSRDTFNGVISGRLSPDGKSYLVSGTFARGSHKYLGLRVYDLDGRQLWEHLFTDGNYRSSDVSYGAGGRYVVATAVDYGGEGQVHLLDPDGRLVFVRSIDGWTQPVISSEGSWLAFFNARRRTVQVFGPPHFSPAWSASVGEGAYGVFLEDGPELLVCDAGRARLYGSRGQVLWSVSVPGGGRWNVALSPSGRRVAVTTEDPDSTVYVYSASDGSLLWSQFLVTGGDKRLTFSPDGTMLVVYDVGQHNAIYMINASTGEIPWRYYLRGQEGSTLVIRQLQFLPSGRSMIADIVESESGDDAYVFRHYLLRLTREGKALWVAPLGSDVDVDLDAAAGLALVVTNNPIDMSGSVTNSVTLVSFEPEESAGGDGG